MADSKLAVFAATTAIATALLTRRRSQAEATSTRRRSRLTTALWGLFVGDAFGMPAHWYYDPANITKHVAPRITGYMPAASPHPEAMTYAQAYDPDPANVVDIMHDKRRFFRVCGEDAQAPARAGSAADTDLAGNRLGADAATREHYHDGLAAGENTSPVQCLVQGFMRSVVDAGGYTVDGYLDAFRAFWTTPGAHRDTYLELFVRKWFERYSRGVPARRAAVTQRACWSVGSNSGVLAGLVMGIMRRLGGASIEDATEAAVRHHYLTHNSPNVETAVRVLVPLVLRLADEPDAGDGGSLTDTPLRRHVRAAAAQTRAPTITAAELFGRYKAARGPANIPDDETWDIHTSLQPQPFDVEATAAMPDGDVVGGPSGHMLASACYTEHGLPAVLHFAYKYHDSLVAAMIAHVHVGGDSTARTGIIAAIFGAARGPSAIPQRFITGLRAHHELATLIEAFVAHAETHGTEGMAAILGDASLAPGANIN